jgi:signal transduction histidine kinase
MHDRIEAIGGQITAHAKPGHGTRVVGLVQLP